MKRFAHIGSYNRNLGDNIALYNVRREFDAQYSDIKWYSLDIGMFWNRKNNIKFVIEFFKQNNFDAIVVGGGGLIEYRGYEQHETHFKLPFNEEIMKSLNCPTYFVGLGINYFRGREGFSDEAKASLKSMIELSSKFSLRNDGSVDILKDLGLHTDKVIEVPDPGLIFDYAKIEKYGQLETNVIQPAFNTSQHINEHRFNGEANIKSIVEFANNSKLLVMPHTPKDFRYFSNFIIDSRQLTDMLAFDYTSELVKVYLNFDSIVAFRGHGQLISIGMNIPGLYFSTQDKVRDFSLRNGFEDYNIDINDEDWLDQLRGKHFRLLMDSTYRETWYEIRKASVTTWYESLKNFISTCED
jgi:polysaccharide pyruvyl transferase WcaK-like protein